MKLAEALVERAAAQERVHELNERIQRVLVVQEGEAPAEEPGALLAELEETVRRLEGLVFAINRTNLHAAIADGRPLTAAIARRDGLKMHIGVLDATLRGAAVPLHRVRGTEIRMVVTVDRTALQRERDRLAKEYRALDAAIQAANWQAELME